MNIDHPYRKWAIAAFVAALLPALGILDRALFDERRDLGLRQPVELEQAPPLLAFVTAVGGGFRGVVANALWARAGKLQEEGKFFELYSLANWITKLQPEFKEVWAMQAWNMAWNVSRQFGDPNDRWRWIRSGMELLRDEGLRYNPKEPLLYRELAWIFQDKMGKATDDGHRRYKQIWASEMFQFLGADARPDALLNPAADESRRRVHALREKYRLDPVRMKHVDEHFGPLDWRVPESHAIYWADMGLQHCGTNDAILLHRIIWQSMQASFMRGRLVERPADKTLAISPNLDLIPNVNRTFEEIRQREPAKRSTIDRAYRNFLKDAIFQLYAHHRPKDAAAWFKTAQSQFPDLIPAGVSLDEFVVSEIAGNLAAAKPTRVQGILEGVLTHHLRALVSGEEDEANGYALLARQIYDLYTKKYADAKNVELAPLSQIESDIRRRLGIARPGSGDTSEEVK